VCCCTCTGPPFRRRFRLRTGSTASRGAMLCAARASTSGRSTSWGSADRTDIRRWRPTPMRIRRSAWLQTWSHRSRRRCGSSLIRAIANECRSSPTAGDRCRQGCSPPNTRPCSIASSCSPRSPVVKGHATRHGRHCRRGSASPMISNGLASSRTCRPASHPCSRARISRPGRKPILTAIPPHAPEDANGSDR
jgi:hypothetical protein